MKGKQEGCGIKRAGIYSKKKAGVSMKEVLQ